MDFLVEASKETVCRATLVEDPCTLTSTQMKGPELLTLNPDRIMELNPCVVP